MASQTVLRDRQLDGLRSPAKKLAESRDGVRAQVAELRATGLLSSGREIGCDALQTTAKTLNSEPTAAEASYRTNLK
jgi:hypothetical protein